MMKIIKGQKGKSKNPVQLFKNFTIFTFRNYKGHCEILKPSLLVLRLPMFLVLCFKKMKIVKSKNPAQQDNYSKFLAFSHSLITRNVEKRKTPFVIAFCFTFTNISCFEMMKIVKGKKQKPSSTIQNF